MSPFSQASPWRPLAAFAFAAFVTVAHAQDRIYRNSSLTYSLKEQSIWPENVDLSNLPPLLFGFDMPNLGGSLGDIYAGTGVKFDWNLATRFGIECPLTISGGTFDMNYVAGLTFDYNRKITPGQTYTVNVKLRPSGYSSLTTTTPTYNFAFDLVGRIKGDLGVRADFLSIGPWSSPRASFNEGSSWRIADWTDMTHISDSGLVDLLSPLPVGFHYNKVDVPTSGGVQSKTLNLRSVGYSPAIVMDTTAMDLIAALGGPVGDAVDNLIVNGEYAIDPYFKLKYRADLLNVDLALNLGIDDAYTVKPKFYVRIDRTTPDGTTTHGYRTLLLDDSGKADFTDVAPPSGGITYTGEVEMGGQFVNEQGIGIGGSAALRLCDVEFDGRIGNGSWSKGVDFSYGLPPIEWVGPNRRLATFFNASTPIAVTNNAFNAFTVNAFDGGTVPSGVYVGYQSGPEEAEASAYNGWTMGQFDPPDYQLVLVPNQGIGFGDDLTDDKKLKATFDGLSAEGVETASGGRVTTQWSNSELRINVPAKLLKPGIHSVTITLDNTWNGAAKRATYTVPVNVTTPTPRVDGEMNTALDLGGAKLDRAPADGRDVIGYMRVSSAFLSSDVVIDDTIVIPSEKYLHNQWVASNAQDDNQFVGANLETDFFFSGNNTVKFTIPGALAKTLAGSAHTIRLRTRDFVKNEAVLSPLNEQASQVYFVAGAPTISSVTVGKRPGALPLSQDGYTLCVHGKNFTPSTTAQLFVGYFYKLQPTFVDSTLLTIPLSKEMIDLLHLGNRSSLAVELTTPEYLAPATALEIATTSGGAASKSVPVAWLKPAVVSLDPVSPVRGQGNGGNRLSLKIGAVNGVAKLETGAANPATRVYIDEKLVDPSLVNLRGGGSRSITAVEALLPADYFTTSGQHFVQLVNGGELGSPQAVVSDKFSFIVSNAVPELLNASPDPVRLGLAGKLVLNGSGFYRNDSTVYVGGKPVPPEALNWVSFSQVTLDLASGFWDKVPGTMATVSVLNRDPGGGQSKQLTIRLVEGNPANVGVSPGEAVYDPTSDSYRQTVTIQYTGKRQLAGKVVVGFSDLPPGVTLVNSDGLVDGLPTRAVNVSLLPGDKTTFTAVFRKTSGNIRWKTRGEAALILRFLLEGGYQSPSRRARVSSTATAQIASISSSGRW